MVKLENKPLISANYMKYLLHDVLIQEHFICRVIGLLVYSHNDPCQPRRGHVEIKQLLSDC